MLAIHGVVRDGRIELQGPAELPEGACVLVVAAVPDGEGPWPTDPASIAARVASMTAADTWGLLPEDFLDPDGSGAFRPAGRDPDGRSNS